MFIPASLLRHRSKYRRVFGKLYLVNKHGSESIVDLIKQLGKEFPNETVAQVLKRIDKPLLASPKQIAEFERAEQRLAKYLEKQKAAKEKSELAYIRRLRKNALTSVKSILVSKLTVEEKRKFRESLQELLDTNPVRQEAITHVNDGEYDRE